MQLKKCYEKLSKNKQIWNKKYSIFIHIWAKLEKASNSQWRRSETQVHLQNVTIRVIKQNVNG